MNGSSKMNKKVVLILAIVLIVIIMGVNGYIVYNKYIKNNNISNNEAKELFVLEDSIKKVIVNSMENEYNNFDNDEWKGFALWSILSDLNDINSMSSRYRGCGNSSNLSDADMIMCGFNMSLDEFNKADKTLFESISGGSTNLKSFYLDAVKDALISHYGTYGNMFDKNFSSSYTHCATHSFINDVNLTRIFYKVDGGCTENIDKRREIISDEILDNTYKITYVEYGVLRDDNGLFVTDGNANKLYEIKSSNDLMIKDHMDLFNIYTSVFEKTDGIYKYKDVNNTK